MRVAILGPVVNNTLSGGVGVFDEGLYHGFVELGDDVKIISVAKSLAIENLVAGKSPSNKKISIFLRFGKIAKLLKKEKPDLVISSVQYSIGIKRYKRKWKQATYIQVLHGAVCPINGKFKAWCVNKAARYSKKHFDKVVTVSYLSYALNKKMFNIICDKVIHNGCALISNNKENDRTYDFVYVGRLFRDKEVELIGDAFSLMLTENPNLKLAVAGYGELEPLFTTGKFSKTKIQFLGKLTQAEVRELLSKTKFFISMNPLEPFGTVYNEAIMNGCNIVSQSTIGSAALFIHKDYFHIADCCNKEELSQRLFNILPNFKPISHIEQESINEYFSFKRCALEYKSLVSK